MTEPRNGGGPPRAVREQSTAELVQHVSEQVARLVRDELTLARIEMAEKGRHAGMGAGLFGGGGVIALYGVGLLFLAVTFGLAVVLPLWLSALIVGVVLLAIAGLMALLGRSQVRQSSPAMPEEASRGVRADMDTFSDAFRNRGQE